MKKSFRALCLTYVLLTGFAVFAQSVKKDLSEPIPQAARKLVAGAIEIENRDPVDRSRRCSKEGDCNCSQLC